MRTLLFSVLWLNYLFSPSTKLLLCVQENNTPIWKEQIYPQNGGWRTKREGYEYCKSWCYCGRDDSLVSSPLSCHSHNTSLCLHSDVTARETRGPAGRPRRFQTCGFIAYLDIYWNLQGTKIGRSDCKFLFLSQTTYGKVIFSLMFVDWFVTIIINFIYWFLT